MTDVATMSLADFLLARLDDDEAVARAAVDPARPGTHWLWVDTKDDRPTVPSDEFPGLEYMTDPTSLRTIEEYATTSVGDLPAFAISYVDEIRSGVAAHIARHDPARVLAECEAKRRIVEWHHPSTDHGERFEPYCVGCYEAGGEDGAPLYPCLTVRLLALPYADHPSYREKWKP